MAKIRPFKGFRPRKDVAAKIASPPYDVLNSEEARVLAEGDALTFLHVNKPEIDLPPETDHYAPEVYAKGRENLDKLINDGYLVRDETPCFYLYAQKWNEHRQVGLVVGASVQEYIDDLIKKHELTRKAKEDDRIAHMESLNAQVGPVFLTYRHRDDIDNLVSTIEEKEPDYDFTSADGIQHTFWVISSKRRIEMLMSLFEQVEALYVADGHHRSASAAIVGQRRREKNPNYTGQENWNSMMAVLFPDNQLKILDYNRVVVDLNGRTDEEFIAEVEKQFYVSKANGNHSPERPKVFGMYMNGQWYRLEAKPGTFDAEDEIDSLDVAILQNNLLTPILGIQDPRTDDRIDFVGGIRGLGELEKRVDSGEMKVAFAMHATTIGQLLSVADAGKIMPPKSTWFEPKLRSGLVINMLDD